MLKLSGFAYIWHSMSCRSACKKHLTSHAAGSPGTQVLQQSHISVLAVTLHMQALMQTPTLYNSHTCHVLQRDCKHSRSFLPACLKLNAEPSCCRTTMHARFCSMPARCGTHGAPALARLLVLPPPLSSQRGELG